MPGYKAASVTKEDERSFIITNEIDTIDVSGRALWQKPTEAGLPDKVTVTLKVQKAGETISTLTSDATAANGWTYGFVNVPAVAADGTSYSYDITAPDQMTVTDGVYSQYSAVDNDTHGKDFTYRLQESVAIQLSKVWKDEDDRYGTRPDQILFHVVTTVDGEVTQEQDVPMTSASGWKTVLVAKDRWQYTEGSDTPSEYTYTVTEQPVDGYQLTGLTRAPEQGYTKGTVTYTAVNTLSCDSFTVTNTVINGSSVLPFTYRLQAELADGTPLTGTTNGLTFDDQGKAVFTLKHGESKQLVLPGSVTVEVTQDEMPGYVTTKEVSTESIEPIPIAKDSAANSATGTTVAFTNDLSFTVYGIKTVDGEEPGSAVFTFQLLDSKGTVLAEAENAADGSFTFSPEIGLTDQSKLTFTVKEAADTDLAKSYIMDTEPKSVTVTLPAEGGVSVSADEEHPVGINNRTATTVTVYKTWEDGAYLNIASRLTLYANGDEVDRSSYKLTVTDGNSTYTFTGLAKQDGAGRTIVYSVTENAPSGYIAVYPNDQSWAYDGDLIRNTLAMTLTVNKVWKNVDKDGKKAITLDLYKNGELYRTFTREPNESGTYRFTIPYDTDASYWFVERALTDYKTTYENPEPYADVTDRAYNGGTIINTGTKMPLTGDDTPVLALSLAAALSLTGLVLLRRRRR